MHITTNQFPRVWVCARLPSNWKSELDTLLGQGERFVLLTHDLPDKEHADVSDRKEFALWFKRNRKRFAEVCAGSIMIVPNEVIALTLIPVIAPLSKVFGYPVRAVTEDRLDHEVTKLLGKLANQ